MVGQVWRSHNTSIHLLCEGVRAMETVLGIYYLASPILIRSLVEEKDNVVVPVWVRSTVGNVPLYKDITQGSILCYNLMTDVMCRSEVSSRCHRLS
jgi:hypothetical protein